ncbi:MAG: DUF2788 domain-containing protein [Chromatiales bacterium]|jgi:hypothetical protein|nr:DUF2788 domain-containing protein [Chromatiales bacterium]
MSAGPGPVTGIPVEPTVFGLTEPELAEIGLTWGIGALIVMMLAIIWKIARESQAGRFGTFVLFFVLAFGMVGFIAKGLIARILGIG